jgi:hypothetical protein
VDLDELKQRWHREADGETQVALDAGSVSGWIAGRARGAKREVRRRLRREAAIYIAMLVALSAMVLMQGINGPHLTLVGALNLAVGAIIATLWYSQKRIADLPLHFSVHQVLVGLLSRVESASRAYQIAFVGFIGCAVVLINITTWRQTRSGVWLTLTVLAGAAALGWASRSGRTYVSQMFGPYRAELADCLREVENFRQTMEKP